MTDLIDDPVTRATIDVIKARVSAVERAAVETVRQHKAKLDAEHQQRKPEVHVNPVHEVRSPEVHVNVAALPVELVLKALKDLADVATAMPVPVIQQPAQTVVVNPTPVVVDLQQLELLVGTLTNWVIQSNEDAQEMRSIVDSLRVGLAAMCELAKTAVAVNEALLAKLSQPRPKRVILVEHDERGEATRITEE